MPCPEVPEIYILSERMLFKKRAEIVEQTHAIQKNESPDDYSAVMEMVHGDLGSAIIIRQKDIKSPEKYSRAEEEFSHTLWHELGHYVAISAESSDRHRYMDNKNPVDSSNVSEYAKQQGYRFWTEFIAEAIANHVTTKCNQEKEDYHPEMNTWEPMEWRDLNYSLMYYLSNALDYYMLTIKEYDLAFYFALLLTDDLSIHYQKAAAAGKLRTHNCDGPNPTKLIPPGSIDPTRLCNVPEAYHIPLKELRHLLEKQLEKEEFWIISDDEIEEIGHSLVDLRQEKLS